MARAFSLSRQPLIATTNNSNSPPLPTSEIKGLTYDHHRPLRRKTALQDLPHLDSSESFPSKHTSIYDASLEEPLFSNFDTSSPVTATDSQFCDRSPENLCQFKPHRLSPITEKSSRATLFNGSGVRQPSSMSHLIIDSAEACLRSIAPPSRSKLTRNKLRKKSFSLTDLPPQQQHFDTPNLFNLTSLYSQPTSPADPLLPSRRPPNRRPTSPNIPKFGSQAAQNYVLPPPLPAPPLSPRFRAADGPSLNSSPIPTDENASLHPAAVRAITSQGATSLPSAPNRSENSLHRLLQRGKIFQPIMRADRSRQVASVATGATPATAAEAGAEETPEMREYLRQTRNLPRGCVMRGDDGTLVRGRFLPGLSGHMGVAGRVPGGTRGSGRRGDGEGVNNAAAVTNTATAVAGSRTGNISKGKQRNVSATVRKRAGRRRNDRGGPGGAGTEGQNNREELEDDEKSVGCCTRGLACVRKVWCHR